MKVITEAILRDELRGRQPEAFYIPEGKILSPAAREYLQQLKIKILTGPEPKAEADLQAAPSMPDAKYGIPDNAKPKFIDFETGAFYMEKPEFMTHLSGNTLVAKNHPRILFRGKLDSLQALIVETQCEVRDTDGGKKLVEELQGILGVLREMMRCDVMDEPFSNERILGLTHAELRERSHDPMKFYSIKQMVLPDYSLGRAYAMLNRIRTAVRETEVAAVEAFQVGKRFERNDIIEALNRLSSAMHVMMCMYLAGLYK